MRGGANRRCCSSTIRNQAALFKPSLVDCRGVEDADCEANANSEHQPPTRPREAPIMSGNSDRQRRVHLAHSLPVRMPRVVSVAARG